METTSMRSLGWLIVAGLVAAAGFNPAATSPKFYPDDPIATVTDSQDASGVRGREIGLAYDTLENSFLQPGDRTLNVRAQNLNTVDEVPDSSWFTNRAGVRTVTVDELIRGSGTGRGPAQGAWTVISAKNDGVMPGFTVRDADGQVWFIKFDPPGYPAMATGTEMLVTRLLWALGYHVAEAHLATLRPEDLTIDSAARITPPNGNRRPFTPADIRQLLRRAHRDADGSFRVLASKALTGRPIGGFRFYGTRPDDPNDVVPHEHRRELRAYGTFAAWLNHVDSKSINTMDTVIEHEGRHIVRHHLLDFGSTIGSAGVYPREPYEGWEQLTGGRRILAGIPSFGFYIKEWRTIPIYRARSVGAFPIANAQWDPEKWSPRYPNTAFQAARLDDKFWAARRLQAITDEMLAAVISTGRFADPASERMLLKFLVERRDAIVRRYLPAVNPVTDVRLSASGSLTFQNAALDARISAAPAAYAITWSRLDNATGEVTRLSETRAHSPEATASEPLPAALGSYLRVQIAAIDGRPSWAEPALCYFRRDADGWKLVGFERVPDGNPPAHRAHDLRTIR